MRRVGIGVDGRERGGQHTCDDIWAAVGGQSYNDGISTRFHAVFQPKLPGGPHIEALICGYCKLLPQAWAAQLRLRLCTGVTTVYLLRHMALEKHDTDRCAIGGACDA